MIFVPIAAWIATSYCWRGICLRRRSVSARPALCAFSRWTTIDKASTGSPASRMSIFTRSRGRVHRHLAAVGQRDLVLDVRGRGQQLEVVLALEPLADDVHVQQAEEAAAEAEAEGLTRLRLPGEGRVVQRQLLERVAQVLELV